jgi:hypothetical protein
VVIAESSAAVKVATVEAGVPVVDIRISLQKVEGRSP